MSALFVAGTDLTHNFPDRKNLGEAIGNVGLVVGFSEREDDFSSRAHFVCPDHHPLESWMDAEPVDGVVSLSQPLLKPLGETRSILESLAHWLGRNESAYEILRSNWEKKILPRVKSQSFRSFWDQTLHDGFVEVASNAAPAGKFRSPAVRLTPESTQGDYCLTLYNKGGLTDSRHAHNPWLQELLERLSANVAPLRNRLHAAGRFGDTAGVFRAFVL